MRMAGFGIVHVRGGKSEWFKISLITNMEAVFHRKVAHQYSPDADKI